MSTRDVRTQIRAARAERWRRRSRSSPGSTQMPAARCTASEAATVASRIGAGAPWRNNRSTSTRARIACPCRMENDTAASVAAANDNERR